jgi:hypothetical protein
MAVAEQPARDQQGAVSGLQWHAGGLHPPIAGKTDQADFAFDSPVLSPGDAAEIAMRKDFPKG